MSTKRLFSRKRQRTVDSAGGSFAGWTICVHLSRAAQVQGEIFTRNMRQYGANVIENIASINATQVETVIVADGNTVIEAVRAAQSLKQKGQKVHVVSQEWAISSLRDMKPLPCEHFSLRTSLTTDRNERYSTELQAKTNEFLGLPASFVGRSVWDPLENSEANDECKQMIVKAIPKWMVMRFTYNASLVDLPNHKLANDLRKLAQKRKLLVPDIRDGDIRALVYKRAAAAVSVLPFRVTSVRDVKQLRGLSSSISSAIEQFCSTGQLSEVLEFETSPRLRVLAELTSVFGISVAFARSLYDQGVKSTEDALHKHDNGSMHMSTDTLRALRWHSHLREPVTVYDGIALFERVRSVASSKLHCKLRLKLCGGFRRGEPIGHDLDILYTHEDEARTDSISHQLLEALETDGVLIQALRAQQDALGHREQRYYQTANNHCGIYEYAHDTVLAVCKTSTGKAIRVDFVGIRQASEMPFATLAWSGSILFQRDLRQYASERHGWIFSAHGIFDAITGKRVTFKPLCRTEHDVFRVLGLKYVAPFERCC